VDGARVQKIMDEIHVTLNKNSVPGDKSAIVPGGIRIRTPALTTRGFTEEDFEQVRRKHSYCRHMRVWSVKKRPCI
jgi:glycine hydroxymethyltransferase